MKASLSLLILIAATSGIASATDSGAQGSSGGVLEYGIGVTNLSFPHYPGSDQSHVLTLPFPFLSYYSEKLELDGAELQGRLWRGDYWTLDISTGGALPVDADDNEAREGMDDLHWMGEVGPALRYSPEWSQVSPDWQFRLTLPLRQTIEADGLDFTGRGWVFIPNLHAKRDIQFGDHRWELQSSIGLRYSSQRYHQHFYGVPADQVTADRPAYDASQGLTAYNVSLGLSWRREQWWIGGFIWHYDYSNSAVRDSPLLRDLRQQSIGLSAAYILGERRF
jgi:MipA family protein